MTPLGPPPEPPRLEVEAGWLVGAWRSSQTPERANGGSLYPSQLSQGWESPPGLASGLAIGARVLLGERLGLEASLLGAAYEEALHSAADLPAPAEAARQLSQGTLSVLAHRELGLGPLGLEADARLGLWAGSLILHGLDRDDAGATSPEVVEAWMAGPQVGASVDLRVSRGWSCGAGAGVGTSFDLSPAWTAYQLDLRRGLVLGLYAEASLQWTGRIIDLYDPEDGRVTGTSSDQLGAAQLSIGFAR